MRTTVGRDDARVVDHLVDDHDVARSLQNLQVVVVGARDHRRPGVEAHDAAVGQAAVGVGIRKARVGLLCPFRVLLARSLRKGNSPIRRIHDERRALVLGELASTLVPELVVGQHAALRPRCVPGARRSLLRIEQIAVLALVLRGFEGRRFLGGQGLLPFKPSGTLQGRDRAERESALYVRFAVRRPGRRPGPALASRGSRCQHGHRQDAERRYEISTVHLNPPELASR